MTPNATMLQRRSGQMNISEAFKGFYIIACQEQLRHARLQGPCAGATPSQMLTACISILNSLHSSDAGVCMLAVQPLPY